MASCNLCLAQAADAIKLAAENHIDRLVVEESVIWTYKQGPGQPDEDYRKLFVEKPQFKIVDEENRSGKPIPQHRICYCDFAKDRFRVEVKDLRDLAAMAKAKGLDHLGLFNLDTSYVDVVEGKKLTKLKFDEGGKLIGVYIDERKKPTGGFEFDVALMRVGLLLPANGSESKLDRDPGTDVIKRLQVFDPDRGRGPRLKQEVFFDGHYSQDGRVMPGKVVEHNFLADQTILGSEAKVLRVRINPPPFSDALFTRPQSEKLPDLRTATRKQ